MLSAETMTPPRTPPKRNNGKAFDNGLHPHRSSGTASKTQGKHKDSSRALNTQSITRETFLDEVTPTYDDGKDDDSRDSHDLSLNVGQGPRASLVDNLLLSLDQFSRPGLGALDDTQLYSFIANDQSFPNPPYSTVTGRRRASSYSSTISSHIESEPTIRHSTERSRGRRSHSSSNFQSSLGRIDSLRTLEQIRARRAGHQRGASSLTQQGTSNAWMSGRAESTSSSSSSFDAGPSRSFNPSRGAGLPTQRSMSFDNGHSGRVPFSTSVDLGNNNQNDPVGAMVFEDDEAAPTPVIPAGPRSTRSPLPHSMSFPSHVPRAPPPTANVERRGSVGSLKTRKSFTKRPNTQRTQVAPTGLDEYPRTADLKLLPPLPGMDDPAAPSPAVSYRKSSAPATVATRGKEKQGFFRRVFGSNKQNLPLQPQPQNVQPVYHSPMPSEVREMPQTSYPSRPATSKEPPSHSVNKKSSSFFRRRKKSVSDAPLPPLPIQHIQNASIELLQTSPGVSLRKIMDPYLLNGERRGSIDSMESPRGFSPGYNPHKNSTIRPVRKQSKDDYEEYFTPLTSAKNGAYLEDGSGEYFAPAPPKKVADDSFLQDSSGNEERDDTPRGPVRSTSMPYSSHGKPSGARSVSVPDMSKHQTPSKPSRVSAPVIPLDISEESEDTPKAHNRNESSGGLSVDEWISKTPMRSPKQALSPSGSGRATRLWLEPTSSEEQLAESSQLSLPLEGTKNPAHVSNSTLGEYQSALSTPAIETDTGSPAVSREEPLPEDYERAKAIYEGTHQSITMSRAAGWLGESNIVSRRTRVAYMSLFEWANMSILSAMRSLCSRLVLKGETQQVDRILDAFTDRWCQCNPNHGFKASDVVHTICYSLLLLNTDLHLADIEQKMTRNQFIKNTMPTIRRVAADAATENADTVRPATVPKRGSIPWRESDDLFVPVEFDGSIDQCGPLVKAPFHGSSRAWESQVEAVLKAFFSSIKQQRLPLHGASDTPVTPQISSGNSLSVATSSMLRRSPSTISRAASENPSLRVGTDQRPSTGRWQPKARMRSKIYGTIASSRSSFDDGSSSVFTPSGSSVWSKYSFGKTQTSMSVESLGSVFTQGDYQQSIGFANALSQAIIREEGSIHTSEDIPRTVPLLEDESLELAGAPWAKEGMVKHKRHIGSSDKKSRDKNWDECFAVVEKGKIQLFSFSSKNSLKSKKGRGLMIGGVVGGGNWMDNAEQLGSFTLRQTLASALPPPGYSKTRPHVWALSLPSGAVHLFQVGTPEIVKEFVSTANYWSARLSKEPLIGGVSNIEYGWSDSIVSMVQSNDENTAPGMPRPSIQSSIRSSMEQGTGTVKPRLPGDKITISEWSPPQQSFMASSLLEADQLKALMAYVKNVEDDLQKHNELRASMLLAFSPRHPNATKAMANWERKSSYLLREIVKFRTYIDCLTVAQKEKERIYAERGTSSGGAMNSDLVPGDASIVKEESGTSPAETPEISQKEANSVEQTPTVEAS